jgi:signal transduction histidine kinase
VNILPRTAGVDRQGRSRRLAPLLRAVRRYNALLVLFVVCCGVAVVGGFVIRDLRNANAEAQEMYTRSVHGLKQIGELQYDAQETRRSTLYALSTTDSNLQVDYADQSRAADQRVETGIAEYARHTNNRHESELADRLSHDWAMYLNLRDEVLALILEGSTKEAVSLDLSQGVPAFERVREDLLEVQRLYDQDASRRQANLASSSRRSSIKLIGILGFTFLISTAAIWAVQRSRMTSAIQLARMQMEFVASVSHELRTPLAVMRSAADNLADGLIHGEVAMRKYGTILRRQSRSMAELVDQILLFASTEDHHKHYVLQPLDVVSIINSTVAAIEGLTREHRFVFDRQIQPNLPPVLGDREAISQCLQNLVGNAVKYSGQSKLVTIRAFTAPAEAGTGDELRIAVEDRGIGIDSSELSRIFDPFYRSAQARTAQIHGTGLGLSLAKRIVEAMGGRISVISELYVGSTFTLHFEIARGEDMETAGNLSGQAAASTL